MPASVQGCMDIAVDKAGKDLSLIELTFKEGRRYIFKKLDKSNSNHLLVEILFPETHLAFY